MELFIIEPRRIAVERENARTQAALFAVRLLRNGHIDPLGQKAHSVRKGEVFLLHDEVDNAAALLAAKAVADLLIRRNGERAGLFVMERTQAKIVCTLFLQRNIIAHNVNNIVAGDQLVQKPLVKRHGAHSFPCDAAAK